MLFLGSLQNPSLRAFPISDVANKAMDTLFEAAGTVVGGAVGFALSTGPNYKTERTIKSIAATDVGGAIGSSIGGTISDAIQDKIGWH